MDIIEQQIEEDAKELRDIAEWFDNGGKKINGDFLRQIAHKMEVLYGAYRNHASKAGGIKIWEK